MRLFNEFSRLSQQSGSYQQNGSESMLASWYSVNQAAPLTLRQTSAPTF